jgi:glycosyltransferase involved in cell wall biosynthesis
LALAATHLENGEFMTRATFVIPGDIDLPTGGYAYDRRLLALFGEHGVDATHLALPGTYPDPSPADLRETRRLVATTQPDDILLIDGLAYGAMPADMIATFERRIVALVHHPLCLEAGTPPLRAHELKRLETAALALAKHVVVTSKTTALTLATDFEVPDDRITIAEPGTDAAQRAKGSGGRPFRLLAVGTVVPRKGYDVLVDALVPLKALDWRLEIAGATDRSPETVAALRAQIAREGLAERITLLGPVDEAHLAKLYDTADGFVMASHYEGYGMVLSEALARGLPIVCTTGGAAAETVPDGAAVKVEPASPRALAWSIGRVLEEDGQLRRSIADAAWAAAAQLPRWNDTARTVAAVIKEIAR